jgi:hypothetical protein
MVSFKPRPIYSRGRAPPPPYPLDRWLGWTQNRPGRYGEMRFLYPAETRTATPSVVQPVASRYTDCDTAAVLENKSKKKVNLSRNTP